MAYVHADPEKNRLYITIAGHLTPDDMRQVGESIAQEVVKLSSGFDVINDISDAHPTDEAGLKQVAEIQKYLVSKGMRRVIRVTKVLISELQMKRASQNSRYYWIVAPSVGKAEKLLDAFTMPDDAESQQPRSYARHYRRFSVGPEHTVQFTLGNREFKRIRITNLSADGCFALIYAEDANLFRVGTLLNDFRFEHDDLPSSPLTARVVRIVEGLSEVTDCDAGLGIHFLATSPQFTEWVNSYVICHLENGGERAYIAGPRTSLRGVEVP